MEKFLLRLSDFIRYYYGVTDPLLNENTELTTALEKSKQEVSDTRTKLTAVVTQRDQLLQAMKAYNAKAEAEVAAEENAKTMRSQAAEHANELIKRMMHPEPSRCEYTPSFSRLVAATEDAFTAFKQEIAHLHLTPLGQAPTWNPETLAEVSPEDIFKKEPYETPEEYELHLKPLKNSLQKSL